MKLQNSPSNPCSKKSCWMRSPRIIHREFKLSLKLRSTLSCNTKLWSFIQENQSDLGYDTLPRHLLLPFYLFLSFFLGPLIVFSEVGEAGYRWGGVRFCVLFLARNDVVSSSFFFGNNSFTFSFNYEIKKQPKTTLFWLVNGNN